MWYIYIIYKCISLSVSIPVSLLFLSISLSSLLALYYPPLLFFPLFLPFPLSPFRSLFFSLVPPVFSPCPPVCLPTPLPLSFLSPSFSYLFLRLFISCLRCRSSPDCLFLVFAPLPLSFCCGLPAAAPSSWCFCAEGV